MSFFLSSCRLLEENIPCNYFHETLAFCWLEKLSLLGSHRGCLPFYRVHMNNTLKENSDLNRALVRI